MAKDPTPKTPRKPKKRAPTTSIDTEETPSKRLARDTASIDLDALLDPDYQNSDIRDNVLESVTGTMPFRLSAARDTPVEKNEATPNTLLGNDTHVVDTIEPGLSVLGEHVAKLVDLITTLRDNGVDRLAVDLPQIVVVGDQSTGKSSLIEGLSGIKVPRDEGTCTRCPIEINLRPTTEGDWHCRITIVKKYGWKVSGSNSGPRLGLGPYNVELPAAVLEPFAEVTDKSEIPEWLRRAQLAVLNPGQPYQIFAVPLSQQLECTTAQEPFSPNIVRMDILAPGLPSLSFFDLPGVIVQDTEPHVPKMIRKLVKGYIKSSKSLVLLTLPIDCDRANSQAAGLVDEAGAEGRTIGIISKPDKLVTANIPQWKDILSGKKFKYKLGYRVVKNPADPAVDWAVARQQEREFFETNFNFCVHLGEFQHQFGTQRLQVFLSKHLLTMIRDCLPEIQEKVANRVQTIEQQLSTLPRLPSGNVVFKTQQRIHDFEGLLKTIITNAVDHENSEIMARTGADRWFQGWHRRAQIFYEQMVQSAPQLDLKGSRPSAGVSAQNGNKGKTIVVDDDDDDSSDDDEPTVTTPNQRRQNAAPHNYRGPAWQPTLSNRDIEYIQEFVRKSTKKFTLPQLQSCVHRYNNGVHGISDPRVFEHLIKESTKAWRSCVEHFLAHTGQICRKIVDELLTTLFADLKDTKLLEYITQSTHFLLSALYTRQKEFSVLLLDLEDRSPLTLNYEEQEITKHAVLDGLVEQVQDFKIKRQLNRLTETQGRYSVSDEKRISEAIRNEPNQKTQELVELAGAIAYYRIAARRIADYVTLSIRNNYFHGLITNLQAKLCADLGVSLEGDSDINRTNERLRTLMMPPDTLSIRRRQLERELKVLTHTAENVQNVLQGEHDDHIALKQESRMPEANVDMEE